MADNPLLAPSTLPNGAPPLDQVKAEHFLPAIEAAIVTAKANIAAIKNNQDPATFANTIEALEFSGSELERISLIFSNITSANMTDDLRQIQDRFHSVIVAHGNDVGMDTDLFLRIKEVYDDRANMTLTGEQEMLLAETYKGFVRSGALLQDADKEKLKDVNQKLSDLTTKYAENTVHSTASYKKVVEEAQTTGWPDRIKQKYAKNAEDAGEPGKYVIYLSPPPGDVLEYSEDRALREEISRAISSVSYKDAYDNSGVALDIVRLRGEKAKLLGYDTYAAYVLDDRMTKTPDAVINFLKGNEKVYKPAAEQYLQSVKDYAHKKDGLTDIKPWDLAYYGRLLKEENFSLNLESLRPYFNLENVLDGLRIHAEKLFNIDMTEVKGKYPVYHEDVKVYEIKDKADGSLIGLFYGDFYARKGAKKSGAWMNVFRNRGIQDGENKCAIVTNVCNFQKPEAGKPTFLAISEVTTVFHEFGHALHALLAKGDYPSLTGTNVKWDFVEVPSQLQENWATQKEVLDTFAKHHDTGALLSQEVIDKMNAMENFTAGYVGQRQTFLGLLDMAYYNHTDPSKITSVEELEDQVVKDHWLFPRAAGPMSTNFGHIFAGGYAAGYNSYKWSEVMEADIFEVFLEKGLYHRETAELLRNTIYGEGGTRDQADTFRRMRGRDPVQEPLFRRQGLIGNDNAPKNDGKKKPFSPKG